MAKARRAASALDIANIPDREERVAMRRKRAEMKLKKQQQADQGKKKDDEVGSCFAKQLQLVCVLYLADLVDDQHFVHQLFLLVSFIQPSK